MFFKSFLLIVLPLLVIIREVYILLLEQFISTISLGMECSIAFFRMLVKASICQFLSQIISVFRLPFKVILIFFKSDKLETLVIDSSIMDFKGYGVYIKFREF